MANNTSNHILGTAANLLGFCLIVLTSLHFTSKTENSLIDEVTCAVSMLLILSCIFSFASIRAKDNAISARLETIAEYLFMVCLMGIFAILLVITVKFWLQ